MTNKLLNAHWLIVNVKDNIYYCTIYNNEYFEGSFFIDKYSLSFVYNFENIKLSLKQEIIDKIYNYARSTNISNAKKKISKFISGI